MIHLLSENREPDIMDFSAMMQRANFEILKMPLGFIRLVQLLFAVIAFASLANYHVRARYSSACLCGFLSSQPPSTL